MGVLSTAMWPVTASARGAYRLTQPEFVRARDQLLEGPLTEQIAERLMAHRIPERLAVALNANGEIERLVKRALESQLLVELTEAVLKSEEMQRTLDHLSKSPELGRAIASQSAGLAGEVADGMRRRAGTLDEVAERTVRGWLGKPRPRMA